MACNYPKKYWLRIDPVTKKQRRAYHHSEAQLGDAPFYQPCTNCLGCRKDKMFEQALRQVHEAYMHPVSSMITVTYDDDHLPEGGTLVKKDFQDLIRRITYAHPQIRYAGCGEYGTTKTERPHYHITIFGYDFPDMEGSGKGKYPIFRSAELTKLWGKGEYQSQTVASFSPATAEYICKHNTKRVKGSLADDHYQGRIPEFYLTSRRPAMGAAFVQKFGTSDIYGQDTCLTPNKTGFCRPPRYYDALWDQMNPSEMEQIRKNRKKWVIDNSEKYEAQETELRKNQKEEYLDYIFKQKERRDGL